MTQAVALALHREGLLFFDPQTGTWQTREAYLSGNVRQKLHMAQLEYTNGVSDLDPDILSGLEGNIAAFQQVFIQAVVVADVRMTCALVGPDSLMRWGVR